MNNAMLFLRSIKTMIALQHIGILYARAVPLFLEMKVFQVVQEAARVADPKRAGIKPINLSSAMRAHS
jgi:hypothetical protein